MSESMKIRASMQGDIAEFKTLKSHPEETGLRQDKATGKMVPAHFITHVWITVGGKTVMDAQWGGGISKNPYLALKVKGAHSGDKVVINWEDNKGEKNSGEATIS